VRVQNLKGSRVKSAINIKEGIREGHGHHGEIADAHPLADIEHGHDDKVCNENCTGWVKKWVNWMVRQPASKSPMNPNYTANPFERDHTQETCNNRRDEGVWFLAGPVYSGRIAGTYLKYIVLPPGNWHILASPFASYVSQLEYPSIPLNRLFQKARGEVDTTYRLEASLDGLNLSGCRVQIKDPFETDELDRDNILAIEPEELKKSGNRTKICVDGYFFWLKPLEPGLHILHLVAYSRVYEFDVKFMLNVRGPRPARQRE
jgi:hypothetical protein